VDLIRRARGERFKTRDKHAPSELPDNVWEKCHGCRELIYSKDLDANLRVCPRCGYHHHLTVWQRIAMLADEDSFAETDHDVRPSDGWDLVVNGKPYTDRLKEAEASAGIPEAVVTGRAELGGLPIALAVMAREYMGGSVGSVAGEKIARAVELATDEGRGLVIVSQSGGMRIHEGAWSLMQMAKTSAALARLQRARLPFFSVLTWTVLGGATASWASLGDVILAEPGTQVGFSGPRVLQAIKVKLPDETQRAEFMLEHGMIDAVVPRTELRSTLGTLLRHYRQHIAACDRELAGALAGRHNGRG
jgi:acetyl-CoA carboxylase carboxyl transferase subunit beta